MKSLRFRSEEESLPATIETKRSKLRRFIKKTKKILTPNPSPSPTSRSTSSPPAQHTRELTALTSSSLHLDTALGSAEWYQGVGDSIHALARHRPSIATQPTFEPVYSQSPAHSASSIYSQPGPYVGDSTLPPLQASTFSREAVAEETSPLFSRLQVSKCHNTSDTVKEDECLSFEEALQPHILDMVRGAFSNANMRLLPSTDPTVARIDLLRKVDDFSDSFGSSSDAAESVGSCALYTETTATSNSEGAAAPKNSQTGYGTDERLALHTRGQHSLDVASTFFFTAADVERRQREETSLLPRLTENVEDMSDCLAMIFMTVDECHPSSKASNLSYPAKNNRGTNSGHSYSAPLIHEIETIRAQRLRFAARLEAELSIQCEIMEAEFEKCYETADNLHAVDLLNLKDDHDQWSL